jgi:two-component system, response regulator PdtaR
MSDHVCKTPANPHMARHVAAETGRELNRMAAILIVEDDYIVAMELRFRLLDLEHTVSAVVSSGLDAISKAAQLSPDLILMDIKLRGDMDGLEAARQIRARADIPIVFLTAYSDASTVRRIQAADPCGYIVKPFAEEELRATIAVALQWRGTRPE